MSIVATAIIRSFQNASPTNSGQFGSNGTMPYLAITDIVGIYGVDEWVCLVVNVTLTMTCFGKPNPHYVHILHTITL